MSVPERDAVDQCFRTANAEAKLCPADQQHAVKAIVNALEGVARQIRDADDTQDMAFRSLSEVLNESNTTITASIDSLTQELSMHTGKKGLF